MMTVKTWSNISKVLNRERERGERRYIFSRKVMIERKQTFHPKAYPDGANGHKFFVMGTWTNHDTIGREKNDKAKFSAVPLRPGMVFGPK